MPPDTPKGTVSYRFYSYNEPPHFSTLAFMYIIPTLEVDMNTDNWFSDHVLLYIFDSILMVTLQDLRRAPRLEEVLRKSYHLTEEKVSMAKRCERKTYTPVLSVMEVKLYFLLGHQ